MKYFCIGGTCEIETEMFKRILGNYLNVGLIIKGFSYGTETNSIFYLVRFWF